MLYPLLLSWTDFSLNAEDIPQFHFLTYPYHFHWQDPRVAPLEEMALTVSAVSLALWSESHMGSESATQGQEQALHKKIIDIKHFPWLWMQRDFAFWKLNVESL